MSKVIVETSARHIHLCQEDLDKLFGKGHQLRKLRNLSQPSEFAAQETLIIKTPKNVLDKVRVVGPLRHQTQVEISKTDARWLGLNPPIRRSGDLDGSEKCILIGPKGQVRLTVGVIVAWRHLHLSPRFAKEHNLNEQNLVSVRVNQSARTLTFHNVYIRIGEGFAPVVHLDTDEANAAGIVGPTEGEIIV